MKFIHIFICMVLLSGCISTPPNPVASSIRDSLHISSVEVVWSVKPDDESSVDLDKYNESRDDMIRRIETEILSNFEKSPNGAEGAKFVVNVIGFNSSGKGVVGDTDPRLVLANVTLKRNEEGDVLGVYDAIVGVDIVQRGLVGLAYESVFKPEINQALAEGLANNLKNDSLASKLSRYENERLNISAVLAHTRYDTLENGALSDLTVG